jgi:hypothetical protein
MEPAADRRRCSAAHEPGIPRRTAMMKGGLLWLIGIPLPIILLLWVFGFLS